MIKNFNDIFVVNLETLVNKQWSGKVKKDDLRLTQLKTSICSIALGKKKLVDGVTRFPAPGCPND